MEKREGGNPSKGLRHHVSWPALTDAALAVLLLDEPFANVDLSGQMLLNEQVA